MFLCMEDSDYKNYGLSLSLVLITLVTNPPHCISPATDNLLLELQQEVRTLKLLQSPPGKWKTQQKYFFPELEMSSSSQDEHRRQALKNEEWVTEI